MDTPEPSPRELAVLRILWTLGTATVREVHERLYPTADRSFNTVQTQLRILERKGLATHRREGPGFVYVARYGPQDATRRFLREVCGGSLEQGVRHLITASDATAESLRELERVVARLRRERESGSEPPPIGSGRPARAGPWNDTRTLASPRPSLAGEMNRGEGVQGSSIPAGWA